ncbi:MAG: acetyltransferase [Deltaproteobacteria bacterium]|nr:acetyltransferase [Deltaproteobacteria bacterium]MBW2018289.1 acetyltransferase [Deltaproteobacteria bacterium]
MVKKIIILGTGGNCIDILDIINDINAACRTTTYECAGFLDDNKSNWGKELYGVKVLGPLDSATSYKDCYFVNGIGNPFNFWKKKEIISKTNIPDERFETIIHPSACISSMSQLGHGTVVFQNVTITSNVQIGNHVIILPNCVISHDDIIGDYTCITGGVCISGGVTVGHSCYLGTNAAIIGNIKIGNYCLIGMGSVVLDSIDDNTVVTGNPARYLKKTISEGYGTKT